MTTQDGRQPVVAGVDGSSSAIRAVRWAARQAAAWDSPLRLVHANVWPWIHQPELAGLAGNYHQVQLNAAYDWLRAAADVARQVAPTVAVDTELVTATAGQLLTEESRRARLVVVGSRGLGGFTGLLVGSTAVQLASHGHCPVAVVRGPGDSGADDSGSDDSGPPTSGPVVVGVDGSAANEPAVAFAFQAAASRGEPLLAVHAWSDVFVPASFVPGPPMYQWPLVEADQHRLMAHWLAGWQEKYPTVEVRRVITQGRPAHSLLRAADGAQLLVVGSRGRGGLRGLLLGSTSQALLHHASCPVVIARPETGP